jgi:hypothetical protein
VINRCRLVSLEISEEASGHAAANEKAQEGESL